jgi:hypothetical protein
MKTLQIILTILALCANATWAQDSKAVMEETAGISGNKTFLDDIFVGSTSVRLTKSQPPYWGDNLVIAEAWRNGEGIYFAQPWDNGYTVITANEGILFVVDKNSSAGNEGAIVMDTFTRAGVGVGIGFSGASGMIYGDPGAIAHWQKKASIAPDSRRLYKDNTTIALDWSAGTLEGNWTANGTTFAVSGNATERGAQLTRWRGTSGSDPTTPEAGDMYWNTGNSTLRIYNGTSFINLN